MPPVALHGDGAWLLAGAPPDWPRPPDPHPDVSLVAWARTGGTARISAAYTSWTDVDSWMARSRAGRLVPQVLYTRWVPAAALLPVPGHRYDALPRLRLDGQPEEWPAPAVAPDGTPWYGRHRVYPPLTTGPPWP